MMTIDIRIESLNSGNVLVIINEPIHFEQNINFGLVGSTMAECYGSLVASWVTYEKLKKMNINPETASLNITYNDAVFTEYLLRETTPRDTWKRGDIDYLRRDLYKFNSFSAKLFTNRKRSLRGVNTSHDIPFGIFPNLQVDISPCEDIRYLNVKMPYNPALMAQFKTAFKLNTSNVYDYDEESNTVTYYILKSREKYLWAWIRGVQGRGNPPSKPAVTSHDNNDSQNKNVHGSGSQKENAHSSSATGRNTTGAIDKTPLGKCPYCHDGDIVKRTKGFGCTNYNSEIGCNFYLHDTIKEQPITREDVKNLLENQRTRVIKGFKTKDGDVFDAALVISNGKVMFEETEN